MPTIRSSTRKPGQKPMVDCNVLLVEDQVSVAQMAAATLHQQLGCNVLIATTLGQVNEMLARKDMEIFAAVTDLTLPDAHNGEVVDLLVQTGMPVIAVSGSFSEELHDALIKKGVVDYVLKSSINAYEYIAGLLARLHRNQKIRALVVDDDAIGREVLKHMLQRQLLQVEVAKDGTEGLAALERHPEIKLVLLDQHMPGMDGYTFVAQVREKWGKDRLGVIGMSGMQDRMMSSGFLKHGANDFIAKPVRYDELVCRVNQNLDVMESFEAVRYAAYHDYLTGLFNRRYFFEQGVAAYEHAKAQGGAVCAVMMDIDFFKKINDTYGHDEGDVVLVQMAAMLRKHFPGELVGRMGGEEFALLIEGRQEEALQRLEEFRLAVAGTPVDHVSHSIAFTVSMGLAAGLQESLDAALKLADGSLYQAKAEGRNRIVCA